MHRLSSIWSHFFSIVICWLTGYVNGQVFVQLDKHSMRSSNLMETELVWSASVVKIDLTRKAVRWQKIVQGIGELKHSRLNLKLVWPFVTFHCCKSYKVFSFHVASQLTALNDNLSCHQCLQIFWESNEYHRNCVHNK